MDRVFTVLAAVPCQGPMRRQAPRAPRAPATITYLRYQWAPVRLRGPSMPVPGPAAEEDFAQYADEPTRTRCPACVPAPQPARDGNSRPAPVVLPLRRPLPTQGGATRPRLPIPSAMPRSGALPAALTSGGIILVLLGCSIDGAAEESSAATRTASPAKTPSDTSPATSTGEPTPATTSAKPAPGATNTQARTASLAIPAIALKDLRVVSYEGTTDDWPGTRIQNRGVAASPYGDRGGVGPGEVGNYLVTAHRLSAGGRCASSRPSTRATRSSSPREARSTSTRSPRAEPPRSAPTARSPNSGRRSRASR